MLLTQQKLRQKMMKSQLLIFFVALMGCASVPSDVTTAHEHRSGWLNWRGPSQLGTSSEQGLPVNLDPNGPNLRWKVALAGGGTPVIANGRVFVFGYEGEGADLQELLVCLDAKTGAEIWRQAFSDYISDIIYERYAIGSPAIDPETGNIYLMTSNGRFVAVDWNGTMLWERSLMEDLGRITFPNGRTGAPVIFEDLVIVRGITANWGAQAKGGDRFYAFNKRTGQIVWSSSPGTRPIDSSFSTPILYEEGGRAAFVAGTGCGNVVSVDARTGAPLWRFPMSNGGVNATLIPFEGDIIAIHGKENLDSSRIGRMVRINPSVSTKGSTPQRQRVLNKKNEVWRNRLGSFTSSPVLVGEHLYQVLPTGVLTMVSAKTGDVIWKKKLANEQLHASPLFADGKLYVPVREGEVHVLEPDPAGPKILSHNKLEGQCLGAPAVHAGQLYIHTTKELYAFKKGPGKEHNPPPSSAKVVSSGAATALMIEPSEIIVREGQSVPVSIRSVDSSGRLVANVSPKDVIAKIDMVEAPQGAFSFHQDGAITAGAVRHPVAGVVTLRVGALSGQVRVRVFPKLPYEETFERFELSKPSKRPGPPFAYPSAAWLGGRPKWQVQQSEAGKALVKTQPIMLFQRAITFIGHPDERGYTVEADVKSDGNRRGMSTVGIINQRYLITLKGNWQQLEISSNFDRIQQSVRFRWTAKRWYRLKARVDVDERGVGWVRAKAWPRGTPEPDQWLIEVEHQRAHQKGAPGIFGFSPQGQFPVYVDNIKVYPNS